MWVLVLMVLVTPPEALEWKDNFTTLPECIAQGKVQVARFNVKYPGVKVRAECYPVEKK